MMLIYTNHTTDHTHTHTHTHTQKNSKMQLKCHNLEQTTVK